LHLIPKSPPLPAPGLKNFRRREFFKTPLAVPPASALGADGGAAMLRKYDETDASDL